MHDVLFKDPNQFFYMHPHHTTSHNVNAMPNIKSYSILFARTGIRSTLSNDLFMYILPEKQKED